MSFGKWLLVLVAVLFALPACGLANRRVTVGESFVLGPDESATVKGTGLTVQLENAGHGWYADGSGGFVYAELSVSQGGESYFLELEPGESGQVGEYAVRLLGVDPYGDVPCELVVTRED